jgi:hypothetical protein
MESSIFDTLWPAESSFGFEDNEREREQEREVTSQVERAEDHHSDDEEVVDDMRASFRSFAREESINNVERGEIPVDEGHTIAAGRELFTNFPLSRWQRRRARQGGSDLTSENFLAARCVYAHI